MAWGAAAAMVAAAAGQLGGSLIPQTTPPLQAVGDAIIRATPAALSEALIQRVGRNDKPLLLAGILAALAALGGLAGLLRHRGHPRWADVFPWLLAAAPVAATPANSDISRVREAVLLLAAATCGVMALRRIPVAGVAAGAAPPPPGPRRRPVLLAAFVAASSGTLSVVAPGLLGRPGAALQRRLNAALPRATAPLPTRPDSLADQGVSPLLTPTRDFYRVDTSLRAPLVDPDTWRLRITRDGEERRSYSYDDLLERAVIEYDITLGCVSNQVGGDLIGTARWQGVPLEALLRESGISSARRISGVSVDRFSASFPGAAAFDGRPALVAIGMNGRPLPIAHGFPARLVVAGFYGYTSATKWLQTLDTSDSAGLPGFWADRGWNPDVTVHITSRFDIPQAGQTLTAGRVLLGGIAWAPVVGVAEVQVQVDDGPWHTARLSPLISGAVWRQWSLPWEATTGTHRLRVRARDAAGELQDARRRPVFPSGATGLHSMTVNVS